MQPIDSQPDEEASSNSAQAEMEDALDIERCPRCGFIIKEITWGQTNCPNCGLHFECC